MSSDNYLQRDALIHSLARLASSGYHGRALKRKFHSQFSSCDTASRNNVFNLMYNSLTLVTFLAIIVTSCVSADQLSPIDTSVPIAPTAVSPSSVINSTMVSSFARPSSMRVKCDFDKFPSSGCTERSICNKQLDICECSSAKYPFDINGLCVGYVSYNDHCIASKQCVKGSCLDSNGQEVTHSSLTSLTRGSTASHPIFPSIGTCRCSENFFYSLDKGECIRKVLGRRCTFHTECFHRSHAYCDGSKCKCKPSFVHDSSSDECRPSQWSLCVFHPNGTRNCGEYVNEGTLSGSSIVSGGAFIPGSVPTSLSALFWPIIAFFLVILLLKMLKEGMRRDCDTIGTSDVPYNNVHGAGRPPSGVNRTPSSTGHNRNRSRTSNGHHRHHHHHHHHRHGGQNLTRVPFVSPSSFTSDAGNRLTTPLTCDVSGDAASTSLANSRDASSASPHEIIVLMPPPPYTVSPCSPSSDNVTASMVPCGVLEEPPSYEEATRK